MEVTCAMTSNPLLKAKDLEKSKNSTALVQVFRTKTADEHTQECDMGKNFWGIRLLFS